MRWPVDSLCMALSMAVELRRIAFWATRAGTLVTELIFITYINKFENYYENLKSKKYF
jgi:hypothetical protein